MAQSIDRMVHARNSAGTIEIVRYDREGRWYMEGEHGTNRIRLATVQAAAAQAVAMEAEGGQIFLGRAGGKQFDSKVAGCRRKVSSR